MRVTYETVPQMCIHAFAEIHDLVMEIHERKKPVGDPARYYAHFADAEVKDGCILSGSYGDGATPAAAIENYAREIDMKVLVIRAFHEDRREIQCPRFV